MLSSDFLKTEARTPLHELFVVADAVLEIRTNSRSILKAARDTFLARPAEATAPEFAMRFWVDTRASGQPPWPKPYVRGLHKMVFAGFDSGSSLLIDLRSRRSIGRFSSGMAEDSAYWREVIFPMMVSIVGGKLGMAELHCACVAKNQKGLLLAGPSGSGKSTLSLALTQAGFEFLSDDRTLCSLRAGKLSAWGMPVSPKLRHEAAVWFPQLRGQEPRELQKGERVFRRNLEATLCFKRAPACAPRCIVFLEPMPGSGFQLAPMPRKEAATRLAKGLMAELPEAVQAQIAIIDSLVELTCWRLQYDAPPQDIVDRLGHLLEM